ncbi:MAG: hypothetical protein JWN71_4307 [Xanthobacteraceae bacterium]|nr:hypothetical protein [Xanthobacteraceae bacterium]
MRLDVRTSAMWRQLGLRLGVLVLVVAVLGLPIHDLFRYGVLVAAAVVAFTGAVTLDGKRWLAAVAVALAAWVALAVWPAPRVDEGYNFFFPGPESVKALALPDDVAQVLGRQFNEQYPPATRCDNTTNGCCADGSFPKAEGHAFSSDAMYQRPAYSRQVLGIDFHDPVSLRLGEINGAAYQWEHGWCNIERFVRDRHSLNIFDRFRLTFPLFMVYRFPADFVGSTLCWRGTVMWEGAAGRFEQIDHRDQACRELRADDAGRRIYALSVKPELRLGMNLRASTDVQSRRALEFTVMLGAAIGILLLLVAVDWRRLRLPALVIALTVLAAMVIDIQFLGGFRPLDDGDDGFTYEVYARKIVQAVLAGDPITALIGAEPVYYFTPGFRYFRAIERFLFGDTYLGYLSVIFALPFLVLALFRRFLPNGWAIVMVLLFVATPLGALFGSSLFYYLTWAARGFADPFAFALLFSGFLLIIPNRDETDRPRMTPAFFGALALAAATFVRPNLLLASVTMIGVAGLMALSRRDLGRAFALGAGYAFLVVSPLHNYVFGRSTVLFSDNVNQPQTLLMTPLRYLQALWAMVRLDVADPQVGNAFRQLGRWLSGPTELLAMVPVHAAAVAALVRVGVFGARFDPWLRALALATLVQHGIGLCYVNYVRYNLGTWLLTALVAAVWLHQEGLPLFDRAYPGARDRLMERTGMRFLSERLRRLTQALSA